jgi:hypothetical protein
MYAFRRFEFWVLSFELKRQRPDGEGAERTELADERFRFEV